MNTFFKKIGFLGEIPLDWDSPTLDEITKKKIVYGIVQAGPPQEQGMPYIRSTDVGGVIDISTLLRTTAVIASKYIRSEVVPGDIVFSLRGNIGETSIVPKNLPVANLTQGTARISVKLKFSNSYVRHALATSAVVRHVNSVAKGSTFREITLEDLRKLRLPMPSSKEQERIAFHLDNWDRLIELTERLIAAKQKRRIWLMQQLLTGKRRLSEFGEVATDGQLPAGWRRPRTEEVFFNISKKNCPEATVLSVTQNEGVVARHSLDRKINMNHENTHTYKLVEPGDFVISLRSFQGGLEYSRYRGLVSPAYHVIRPTVKISDDFFRHYFKSPDFIQRLAIATIGIRDGKQISYDDFSFMRIPLPPVEEQHAIAKVINMADRELDLLRAQLDALRVQKKGLMQKLLTGKIRVGVKSGGR